VTVNVSGLVVKWDTQWGSGMNCVAATRGESSMQSCIADAAAEQCGARDRRRPVRSAEPRTDPVSCRSMRMRAGRCHEMESLERRQSGRVVHVPLAGAVYLG